MGEDGNCDEHDLDIFSALNIDEADEENQENKEQDGELGDTENMTPP